MSTFKKNLKFNAFSQPLRYLRPFFKVQKFQTPIEFSIQNYIFWVILVPLCITLVCCWNFTKTYFERAIFQSKCKIYFR